MKSNKSFFKKGMKKLSGIENGRNLIKEFMKQKDISVNDLASAYGKTRVWVQQSLDGYNKGRAVNLFILEVIRDYKIRKEMTSSK